MPTILVRKTMTTEVVVEVDQNTFDVLLGEKESTFEEYDAEALKVEEKAEEEGFELKDEDYEYLPN